MQSLGFLALNAAEASLFKSARIPCSPFSGGFLRSDSSFQFEFSAISLHWLRSLSLFVVVKELKKENNKLGFVFFLLFLMLGLFGVLFLGIGERLSGVVVKIFRSWHDWFWLAKRGWPGGYGCVPVLYFGCCWGRC